MALITVSNVDKVYGADQVLDRLSFQMERGEHVALVGANGTGKSTLLKILVGLEPLDGGQVSLARNAIVTYVAQHARFESTHTLWEAMLESFATAFQAQARMRELERVMVDSDSDSLQEEYRGLSAIADHLGYDYESRIERVLTGLELPPELWSQPVTVMSGGQKTRAKLARALLEEPDLLLLDEPTNHLDIGAIEWLEKYVQGQSSAVLIVAHDRYFLQSVSHRTLELVKGRVEDYPASYLGFLKLREERRARATQVYEKQQEEKEKTEEFIRRFGAGQRSKEAKGRQKRLERKVFAERPEEQQALKLRINASARKGDVVLSLDHMVAGYNGNAVVQGPNQLIVSPGARVAVVGANGAGKTTVARTLIGQLPPVSGSFAWAPGATPAYYAQTTTTVFDPDQTVVQAFTARHSVAEEAARTYLGQFLFIGDEVHKQVGDLSGGERSRLALAVLLYANPSVILLDEPTNHLDIAAREALERALADFGGTLILISHDRYFIDQLVTEIWAIENGRIQVYDGSWSDYQAGRFRRPLTYSSPPPTPKPVKVRSRPEAEVSSELDELYAATEPLLAKLVATSSSAPVDQLRVLTDEYATIQARMNLLVEEMIDNKQ